MRSNVSWKPIDERRSYKIVEAKTIPLFSPNPKKAGQKKSFLKDGVIQGIPSVARISVEQQGQMVPFQEVRGIVIPEGKDGLYILPLENVKRVSENSNAEGDDPVQAAEELAKETIGKVEKFDPKKTLGFSWKQILVIGVIGLAVISLKEAA